MEAFADSIDHQGANRPVRYPAATGACIDRQGGTFADAIMAGETGGGGGGTFPSGPHKFHFLGGTRGTEYMYNENGPILLLLDCFSAIAIVV